MQVLQAVQAELEDDGECMYCENVRQEFRQWRNKFTIQQAKERCRKVRSSYSCGILSSGGLLCTIAAIRSGFTPKFGTEIDEKMKKMWRDLTGLDSLGDTFAQEFTEEQNVVYLKSGQPCTDHSSSHAKCMPPGVQGETGWQYVEQASKILQIKPKAICLEMVANVLDIDGGKAVVELTEMLQGEYYLHPKVLRVAEYGDCSNRERLFIVGFSKTMGEIGKTFRFPKAEYDNEKYYSAKDVAIPDEDVPEKFWIHDEPNSIPFMEPRPLCIHKIGQRGPGMGPSWRPNAVQTHDGVYPTQTTHNGGGTRVPMTWEMGDPIKGTRLTTPVETMRIASLPADYGEFVAEYDESDEFIFKCVNMGVPLRTGCAVDDAVHGLLVSAGVAKDIDEYNVPAKHMEYDNAYRASVDNHKAPWIGLSRSFMCKSIRSIQFDTGANGTFMYTNVEPFMDQKVISDIKIQTAGDSLLHGSIKGRLPAHVLNLAGYKGVSAVTDFDLHPTTVKGLHKELMSADAYFKYGKFNILLRQPDYEDGVSELYRPPAPGIPAARIPLVYDYAGKGGWHMYFIPAKSVDNQDMINLARYIEDELKDKGAAAAQALLDSLMTVQQAVAYSGEAEENPDVVQIMDRTGELPEDDTVFVQMEGIDKEDLKDVQMPTKKPEKTECIRAQHPGEVEIKGVKAGLKHKRKKMKIAEFHRLYSHMGANDACEICKMVKGCMRRIFKKIDPYQETRVGHTWCMDICTFSDRSMKGCRYLVVLRDVASGTYRLLPVARRETEALSTVVSEWIQSIRNDPMYADVPYKMVSILKTDNEGAWGHNVREWKKAVDNMGVQMVHCEPDRHAEENGYAEKAVQTVEITIKQILIAGNLPPAFWQDACADAEFLLNRFPALSDHSAMPSDGDRVRPLEALTRGGYSRRQIDRELSYYIPVGTPCLVHDSSVLGSALEPKVRWGIAKGMFRETVVFFCPYTNAEFRSKSYVSYRLRDGMNYATFLGLPPIESTRKAMMLPEDKLPPRCKLIKLPKGISLKKAADGSSTWGKSVTTGGSVRVMEGKVKVTDSEGKEILTDLDNGMLYYPQGDGKEKEDEVSDKADKEVSDKTDKEVSKNEETSEKVQAEEDEMEGSNEEKEECMKMDENKKFKNMVDIDAGELLDLSGPGIEYLATDPNMAEAGEEELFLDHLKHANQSGVGDSFKNMMNMRPLQDEVPFALRERYRDWLLEMFEDLQPKDIPMKGKLKPGIRFPQPSGEKWRKICQGNKNKSERRKEEENDKKVIDHVLTAMFLQETITMRAFRGKEIQNLAVGTTRQKN